MSFNLVRGHARRRSIPWFLAAALFCALVSSAGSALAVTQTFLSLKGQKLGNIAGDSTVTNFEKQITLQSFSVTPSTPGSGPATISVTTSYYALPQLITALTSGDALTGLVTAQHLGGSAAAATDFSVKFLSARVSSIALTSSTGHDPSVQVDFATNAIQYTNASGTVLTTAIPSIPLNSADDAGSAHAAVADQLKCSGGLSAKVNLTSVSWRLSAPTAGGPITVGPLLFGKTSDGNSDALKAAANRGEALAGTKLVWTGVSKSGTPVTLLGLAVGSAKLATTTSKVVKTSSTTEAYSCTFTTASEGKHEFDLTRGSGTNAITVSY